MALRIGTVDYNHERPDIETLFPGFQNTAGTNGAVGFRMIDTTTLTNGLHTISWTVTDNAGAIDGIGSRFFTVVERDGGADDGGGRRGVESRAAGGRGRRSPRRRRTRRRCLGAAGGTSRRRGRSYGVGGAGTRRDPRRRDSTASSSRSAMTPDARYTGYLRTSEGLAPLPAGSQLDAATGHFTWAPGAGFIGRYDLVFVRWVGPQAVGRREVRIILAPKGSGQVGVQVEIDTPRSSRMSGSRSSSRAGRRISRRRQARASIRCTSGRIPRRAARRCSWGRRRSGARVPTSPRSTAISSAGPVSRSRSRG